MSDLSRATAAILRMSTPKSAGIEPASGVRSVFELPPTRDFSSQPIDWIVENLIAAGTVTLLAGDSGSGKTTLVTAIADAVGKGKKVAGFATAQRPVLMLDRENPLSVVRERLERLGIEDDDHFRVWGGWCSGQVPAAFSPIVLEWVDACDPKPLVIVDSLVSYLEGSENDSAEIRKYMDGYRQLANRGVAVLLLHHTGKADSAKDYRGSSDIKGSVDLAYNLANLGDPSRLTTLRLRAFKSRFTAQTEVVLNYTDGRFLASSEEARPNNHEILVSLLRKHPGVRVAEFEAIAVEKGVRRERARTFLKTGVESNQIRVDFGGHNTRNHTWVGDGQDGPNEPF